MEVQILPATPNLRIGIMGRYSVEKNMLSNTSTQLQLTSNYAPLQFPTSFEKFTIALDRDGVVCENKFAIKSPKDFVPIEGSFRAIAIMRSKGHKIIFLYDQPKIIQKKVTIEEVEDCNRHMLKLLGESGCISIDGIWYNTSSRKGDIYAKPNNGLFKHAEKNIPNLSFKNGVYIGDSLEDLIMADRYGLIPVLVRTGNGRKTEEKLQKSIYRLLLSRVKIFDNLMSYAESL